LWRDAVFAVLCAQGTDCFVRQTIVQHRLQIVSHLIDRKMMPVIPSMDRVLMSHCVHFVAPD
jgi:hypothetical protein